MVHAVVAHRIQQMEGKSQSAPLVQMNQIVLDHLVKQVHLGAPDRPQKLITMSKGHQRSS